MGVVWKTDGHKYHTVLQSFQSALNLGLGSKLVTGGADLTTWRITINSVQKKSLLNNVQNCYTFTPEELKQKKDSLYFDLGNVLLQQK